VSIFRRGRQEQAARHGRSGERRTADSFPGPAADELAVADELAGGDEGGGAGQGSGDPAALDPESEDVAARGPLDREDVHSLNGRLDLGSLWITGVPGMELRIEVEQESGRLVGATAVLGESALQLHAFAAPRKAGVWDGIRDELAQSIATGGGTAEEAEGPWGTELRTRMPSAGPDGRTVFAPARFIGIDGPRWFLRAVLSGRAAIVAMSPWPPGRCCPWLCPKTSGRRFRPRFRRRPKRPTATLSARSSVDPRSRRCGDGNPHGPAPPAVGPGTAG
jgi:hypothetical protein